jgi:23S rRNA pseudouridine1911/1915/1917 synthase
VVAPAHQATDRFGVDAPLVDPAEVAAWVLFQDDHIIVVDKPGWLVCHPSKNGPWSSLVGAMREHLGLDRIHLVSRLDRETSGLVILAKHAAAASVWQTAFAQRRVRKRYLALLTGCLTEERLVDTRLADDPDSPVHVQQKVTFSRAGKTAQTVFRPLEAHPAVTLAEVEPHTGRKHQIRAHAAWLYHPVVGDKIYGPDPNLYLEFIEHGWTPCLAAALPMQRQALHAHQLDVELADGTHSFCAPLPADMQACFQRLQAAH